MTGMAAVALSVAFTSCSHETDVYNPDFESENLTNSYNEAFIRTFGQPAADQDWGFGPVVANTRVINVNGNMWEETPEVTDAEKTLVFNYVNMTKAQMKAAGHKYTEVFPKNITDYFVTQVYTGTDTYSTWDGSSTGILGSSHMDHLQIAMNASGKLSEGKYGSLEGSWSHINNFNASSNTNYGGNTLVNDGGTFDFAYNNSEDSKYHNKWIAVKGEDIDASLAGKYYICFDFIAVNPDAYTNFKFKLPGGNNPEAKEDGEWTEYGPIKVPGCWTVASATAANLEIEYSVWEWNGTATVEVKKTVKVGQSGTKDWSTEDPVGGNQVIDANDVYTDWIVRIVEAQPANEEEKPDPVENIRIIAEDLHANAGSDFDFNDVVFDVHFTSSTTATVTIIAAGGTLPLTVDGHEVHGLFGKSTDTMINTNAENTVDPNDPDGKMLKGYNSNGYHPSFEVTGIDSRNRGNDIEVRVKGTLLTATKGQPAAKVGVKPGFVYCNELVPIETPYPRFATWVQQSNVLWY